MCGIAGKLTANEALGRAAVAAIVASQRHRGPDHEAVRVLGGGAVFGHNRLSILDLDPRSHQPMERDGGRYAISYNGEVYNYRELRQELIELGESFSTTSDTEVVLAAYARWGEDAFRRFNGMFAMAIWDRDARELVLARDRFGEKPLVYTRLDGTFTFASELTALLADPAIRERAHPSVEGMNHYFALGYTLAPVTLIDGIEKVMPGSFMRVAEQGARISQRRYWAYDQAFRTPSSPGGRVEDHCRELVERIDTAVKRRLASDVPVGAFLSGGLDSSSICAFAKRHMTYPLHTFSVGFEAASYDESHDARIVAGELATTHHEERMGQQRGRTIIDDAIAYYDPAFSDTSLVPMVEVSRVAAAEVKVVLSGDGADELFAGYVTYQADALKRAIDVVPAVVRRGVSRGMRRLVPTSNRKTGLGFKLRQFAGGLGGDGRYGHYAWRELHDEDERIALIGHAHAEQIRDTHPFRIFERYYQEVEDLEALAQHLYVDAKTWLADDVLVKVDRATMASSIEARAPYLDPDVAEYAATLPSSMKHRRGEGKWILRRALAPHLPPHTLKKKKAGFNAPINVWLGRSGENEFRFFNRYAWERACLSHPLLSSRAPR